MRRAGRAWPLFVAALAAVLFASALAGAQAVRRVPESSGTLTCPACVLLSPGASQTGFLSVSGGLTVGLGSQLAPTLTFQGRTTMGLWSASATKIAIAGGSAGGAGAQAILVGQDSDIDTSGAFAMRIGGTNATSVSLGLAASTAVVRQNATQAVLYSPNQGSSLILQDNGHAFAGSMGFFGVYPPVVQPATTGTAGTWVAGTGATVLRDSTTDGGVGTTKYNLSDVVKAMKQLGLMAN